MLIHQVKTTGKPLSFNDAYAYAQEHIEKTNHSMEKHLKALKSEDRAKERVRLKEKTRLQNQFRRELSEEQSKQLAIDVNHHHQNAATRQFSLRHSLFGDAHNLNHFQQNLHHHQLQQQRIQQQQISHSLSLR